jgi:hypothetical protein
MSRLHIPAFFLASRFVSNNLTEGHDRRLRVDLHFGGDDFDGNGVI